MMDVSRLVPVDSLLPVIERYAGLSVWVVGDLMLDEYIAGAVDRISPEAPVPVVRVRESENRLGGAANVARQVAALGASVSLAGIVGDDVAGAQLVRMCGAAGIDTRAVIRASDRRTTRKLRVLGHSQQLLRLDWEDAQASTAQMTADMLARLTEDGPWPHVIILSDYAKGVLTRDAVSKIVKLRTQGAGPIVVDPKQRDFAHYRGATTVTPNLRELEAAVGRSLNPENATEVAGAARELAAAADLDALVVTMGERGMLVVPVNGAETRIHAARRAVYDVTGAGDTAIAVLALSLAANASLPAAAQIANAAAGVSVGEIGAVAVDASRIRGALAELPANKIMEREELAARAASWRMSGKRIVFTNGCYDLLHAGHLSLLNGAAKLGDVLVLAINSDESVRRLKGRERPLVPEAERAALLAALACVDAVTIFDEDTPLETLGHIKPHVLVKGADYRVEDVVGRDLVESYGGRVELVPLMPERSTSALVERIRSARTQPSF